jgi:hypothetical protein
MVTTNAGPDRWSKASKPTLAENDALPSNGWSEPNGAANDKGARAAVTQYGYRRGLSFGGYETALRGT